LAASNASKALLYYSDAADFVFWAVRRTSSALEYFALASTSAASD